MTTLTPVAAAVMMLTLMQEARDRPHDDDVILGQWTLTDEQATVAGSHALEGDLTAFLEAGEFDLDNAPGNLPERRKRYRVTRVDRGEGHWRRLTFHVTRTDRYGNDVFLRVHAQVTGIPSFADIQGGGR